MLKDLNHKASTNKYTYIEVLLPLSVSKLFTYAVPEKLKSSINIGSRVLVPFKKDKILTGIILKTHTLKPSYNTKIVIGVIKEKPTLNTQQISFFSWISSYYICELGDVLNAALPSGLKVSVEHGQIRDNYKPKISKVVSLSSHYFKKEDLDNLFIQLDNKSKQLNIILEYFKHIPITSLNNDKEGPEKSLNTYIQKKIFNKDYLSKSALNTLIKNDILVEKEIITSRFENLNGTLNKNQEVILTDQQNRVFQEIHSHFSNKKSVLLHGITGSGKTMIYIKLIQQVLEAGGQALFLMPEIALTIQMVERLKRYFGAHMGIYHSKYSSNARTEVWENVKQNKIQLVLGTRSSIFLPYNDLSLIIIDEEHDYSYKQTDKSPRYNVRDSALVLAKLHNSKVLLGSATPSLESYYNTKIEKYSLVNLNERFVGNSIKKDTESPIDKDKKNIDLPDFKIINLRKKKNNILQPESFLEKDIKISNIELSEELIQEITDQLDKNRQILIFQNRRGYAPYIMCHICGWIPYCSQCDVTLTYHQNSNHLLCHYCGKKSKVISRCKTCSSYELNNISFGTEKLEESLNILFTEAKIARLDIDTIKSKASYENIIKKIEKGEIDIIVGTQIISKGFDFKNIGMVGIVDFDRLIKFPNFRAKERAFQLTIQVSGRAGRNTAAAGIITLQKGRFNNILADNGRYKGIVIIQTYNPDEILLNSIKNYDYKGMYEDEIKERKAFRYPPFTRLIKIIIKHKSSYTLNQQTNKIISQLKNDPYLKNFSDKICILGPSIPLISKIKNLYISNIWIKMSINIKGNNSYLIKDQIKNVTLNSINLKGLNKSKVIFDVDPIT